MKMKMHFSEENGTICSLGDTQKKMRKNTNAPGGLLIFLLDLLEDRLDAAAYFGLHLVRGIAPFALIVLVPATSDADLVSGGGVNGSGGVAVAQVESVPHAVG